MAKPKRLNVRRNIQITPQMLEAGAKEIRNLDPEGIASDGATAVFIAMIEAYQRTDENFWAKVKKTKTCWIYTGSLTKKGYGSVNRGNMATLAHRWSYILEHGAITSDLHVLHKCDNPPCVNPAHLYLGTNQQNSDDRVARGRNRVPFGMAHANSKMTDTQIREIRASDRNQYELAKLYGVSQSVISRIKRGAGWKHVK